MSLILNRKQDEIYTQKTTTTHARTDQMKRYPTALSTGVAKINTSLNFFVAALIKSVNTKVLIFYAGKVNH